MIRHLLLGLALIASASHSVAMTQICSTQEVATCSICLEELSETTITLPCKHQLHRTCLQNMLKATEQATCTLCRAKIPQEVRDQLNLTITVEDHLATLGTYFLGLLRPSNLAHVQQALRDLCSCTSELALLNEALAYTPEEFAEQLKHLQTFVGALQAEHVYDAEELQTLYDSWRPLSQSELIFLLKDFVEYFSITSETVREAKAFIAQHPQGVALLEELISPCDRAEQLAIALKNAPGRWFFSTWSLTKWFTAFLNDL